LQQLWSQQSPGQQLALTEANALMLVPMATISSNTKPLKRFVIVIIEIHSYCLIIRVNIHRREKRFAAEIIADLTLD
jgi:hypothetical protein